MIKKIANPASLVIFTIALIIGLTLANIKPWKNAEKGKSLIDWDITSYYGYLPAAFIHKDLTLSFIKNDSINYAAKHQFWPKKAPNGNNVFKFTMGMSYLYSPFFLIAHLSANYSDSYEANGFSKPYEFFLSFSALFYLIIGLVFLRKTLLQFFNKSTTAFVLFSTVIGTNLFYYCSSEPCMSHAYNFSLISCLIYLTIKWHNKQSIKYILCTGIISGIIVLIRPVNMLIFIFPLLYNVYNLSSLKNKFILLVKNWKQLVLLPSVAFLVILPQLIYWKTITGSWVFHSYIDEHFFFTKPHILDFLISFRKGWFVYTPLMLLAILGFIPLYKNEKKLFFPILMLTLLNIYVLSSWWCWWFGGSFGMRTMIDTYPFYAITLGFFISAVREKSRVLSYLSSTLIIFLIGLNLFQTLQRRNLVIHWDSMTKEAYWENLFTLKFSNQKDWVDQEKLLKHPNYEKAKKGENEY